MHQVAATHYVIAEFWEAYAWIRPKIILWRPIKLTYHEISESPDNAGGAAAVEEVDKGRELACAPDYENDHQ